MDPISMIEAALAVGAAAGAQGTASEVVQDAYTGLKSLIVRRFADKSKVQEILIEHEEDPEVYALPLKKALTDVHAEQDADILTLAQQILQKAKPQQLGLGHTTIQNNAPVYGQNIGENQQITQHFGELPKRA